MTPSELIHQGTLGGPSLSGYAYYADIYCITCGESIDREIATTIAPALDGVDDIMFSDSETVPQPIFFGEHEIKQHYADCGEFMYGGNLD